MTAHAATTREKYPLRIQDFDFDWQHDNRVQAWWTKGHHSDDAMIAACGREYGWGWENIPTEQMRIKRAYYRVVPARCQPWDQMLLDAEPGSRGAFPVTVLEMDESR